MPHLTELSHVTHHDQTTVARKNSGKEGFAFELGRGDGDGDGKELGKIMEVKRKAATATAVGNGDGRENMKEVDGEQRKPGGGGSELRDLVEEREGRKEAVFSVVWSRQRKAEKEQRRRERAEAAANGGSVDGAVTEMKRRPWQDAVGGRAEEVKAQDPAMAATKEREKREGSSEARTVRKRKKRERKAACWSARERGGRRTVRKSTKLTASKGRGSRQQRSATKSSSTGAHRGW